MRQEPVLCVEQETGWGGRTCSNISACGYFYSFQAHKASTPSAGPVVLSVNRPTAHGPLTCRTTAFKEMAPLGLQPSGWAWHGLHPRLLTMTIAAPGSPRPASSPLHAGGVQSQQSTRPDSLPPSREADICRALPPLGWALCRAPPVRPHFMHVIVNILSRCKMYINTNIYMYLIRVFSNLANEVTPQGGATAREQES